MGGPTTRSATAIAGVIRFVRDGWLIAGLVAITLVFSEVAARGIALLVPPQGDPRVHREAVRSLAPEMWQRGTYQWEPYILWRYRQRTSEHLNFDALGRRQTWAPAVEPEDAPSLWMFGGSTMVGDGARDSYTIPSLISRALAETGRPVHVFNFGQSAYVSTQEVLALQAELRLGMVPDAVIFYDGGNDIYSAYQAGRAGLPQNSFFLRQDYEQIERGMLRRLAGRSALFGLLRRLSGSHEESPIDAMNDIEVEALADDVIRVYIGNLAIVEALAIRFGFEVSFFWQPLVWSRQPTVGDEAEIAAENPTLAKLARAVYAQVATHPELAANPRFFDLSGALDASHTPHFYDFVHINEDGNIAIARAMLEAIESVLGSSLLAAQASER